MPFSGSQFQQFLTALMDAFPDTLSLERMLRLGLGKNLNVIAATKNLKDDVFLLIRKAEAEGWAAELLDVACKANPGNQLLQDFYRQHGAEIRLKAVLQVIPWEAPRQAFEPHVLRISAGQFLMGSSNEQIEQAIQDGAKEAWVTDEQPQHTLELGEYAIGLYPVTNREYQVFLQESGRKPPADWNGDQYPEHKASHPVVNVSWYDAWAYCKWLSRETGKAYRLPSEAEWEKAARGVDSRMYPWGEVFNQINANTFEAGIGDTTPAGQFSPQGDSPYDCADMAGNVWEWTHSIYGGYPYQATDGREDLNHEAHRVLRGGAFDLNRWVARCAYRYWYRPDLGGVNFGFRVVVSPG